MADKLRTQQQLEQLQARYIGTGHADTTKFEWTSNIHRDSYASYIGHPPLLEYIAVGMGEPRERVRAMCIEKMIQPVGKPPEVRLIPERALGLRRLTSMFSYRIEVGNERAVMIAKNLEKRVWGFQIEKSGPTTRNTPNTYHQADVKENAAKEDHNTSILETTMGKQTCLTFQNLPCPTQRRLSITRRYPM